jgi:predicted ester cyclase
MSLEKNKLLIDEYIEKVVNTGNVDDIEKYISPDYYEGNKPNGRIVGIEGAKEHILGVRRTYPDLHLTIEQQIAEGDWVVTRVTAHGTHKRTWLGIKPKGKKVEITGVNIKKVIAGRIIEHGGAANMLEALLEIGAIEVVSE